jgi:3-hydroxyisobutyrate dehydrogenase-like beta-hydroxyacid dehydrogenase
MEPVADEALGEANLFLSVVPPSEALPLARRFSAIFAAAKRKPVYLDCNAVNPETVRRIAEVVTQAGSGFIDASIIGGPPKAGAPGPTIYLSGPRLEGARILTRYGLSVREIEGGIGAASALKMAYGGITKGITAIGAAMILGAVRAGVDKALLSELAESQPHLLDRLEKGVPGMFPKAYRWVAEMEEVAGFVGGEENGAAIHRGAAELYRHLAEEFPDGPDIAALRRFFSAPPKA